MYKIKSVRIYPLKLAKKDLFSRKIEKNVDDLKKYRNRIILVAQRRYNCEVDVSFEYSINKIDNNFEIYKGFEI